MSINSSRPSINFVKVILFAVLLIVGSVVGALTMEKPKAVSETTVTSRPLPGNRVRSLTAVVVELAPGARAARHHHAGTVFAYVLEGAVQSQLNDGEVIEYRAGKYWIEPPGAEHTLTQNSSRTELARLLAVFVAPPGARLTTYDK